MTTPINIPTAETGAAMQEWIMKHDSSGEFEIGSLHSIFHESSSESSDEDYINPDRQDELHWLTTRICAVFDKIIDHRERYEMKSLVEKNLSHVIGTYRPIYKPGTPKPYGYMPCQ